MVRSDTLRLWASLIDYQQDVRLSEGIIKTISEQYRKIRNTFKFLLGNISSFDQNENVEITELIDKCILAKFESVKNDYLKSFSSYDFINAMTKIMNFMSSDLSSFYLDITKDILYCEDVTSLRRKQVVKVLNEITYSLMVLLNPILPFTMEEVNQNYPFRSKENVQLYPMLKESHEYDESFLNKYDLLLALREDVFKECENKRNEGVIKSNQEAKVFVNVFDSSLKEVLKEVSNDELTKLLIVSSLIFDESLNENKGKVAYIKVIHHEGEKCKRCWNYFDKEELKEVDGEYICPRCLKVLKK